MVGGTLAEIRERLDDLAVAVGPYRVVGARTGDGPFPVTGRQFPDRETAAEAATLAAAYRRALRRYDPGVTIHELVVTEAMTLGEPNPEPPRTLPEYCHRVAGALFETLSEGHGEVERRVMDAYLDAADRVADRQQLCLALLERSADALADQLTASEQATVLLATAERLSTQPAGTEPLAETLDALTGTGLLREYRIRPVTDGPGRRAHRVTLVGYRPSLSAERCPVLPVAVELLRRTAVPPHITDPRRTATGWELLVATAGDCPATGLSVARARS